MAIDRLHVQGGPSILLYIMTTFTKLTFPTCVNRLMLKACVN